MTAHGCAAAAVSVSEVLVECSKASSREFETIVWAYTLCRPGLQTPAPAACRLPGGLCRGEERDFVVTTRAALGPSLFATNASQTCEFEVRVNVKPGDVYDAHMSWVPDPAGCGG